MKPCFKCGIAIGNAVDTCPDCGALQYQPSIKPFIPKEEAQPPETNVKHHPLRTIAILTFISLCFIHIGVLAFLPFGSEDLEFYLIMTGFCLMVTSLFGFLLYGQMCREMAELWPIPIMLILTALLMFSWRDRLSAGDKIHWAIDGTVTEKYQAGNRGSALRVEGDKGGRFEGVNHLVWKQIKIGDNITKPTMSPYGLVNDVNVLLIEKRFWAGPRSKSLVFPGELSGKR